MRTAGIEAEVVRSGDNGWLCNTVGDGSADCRPTPGVEKHVIKSRESPMDVTWNDAGWAEGQIIGAPVDNARNNVITVNTTYTFRNPNIPIPINQWTTIDLANGSHWQRGQPNLPEDVKAVCLSGLLVTTNSGAATSNMYAFFRATGSTHPAVGQNMPANWPASGPADLSIPVHSTHQMQVIAAVGDGDRSTACVWVPVVDRKFDFFWWHNGQGSFAIYLHLQAYVR
jgi:hypothetical protein